MENQPVTMESVSLDEINFVNRVYGKMSLGLFVTTLTAFVVAVNPPLIEIFIGNVFVFYGLLLAQLGIVIYLSKALSEMSSEKAEGLFLFYSFSVGLTFSVFFLVYTGASIFSTFLTAGLTFAIMSYYGHVTKRDLTSLGQIAIMGLVGLIIASIVNLFLKNQGLDLSNAYAGVLIFVALTAYDTQKIKNMSAVGNMKIEGKKKMAIMGALALYLDFINLFLSLLRIMGRKK